MRVKVKAKAIGTRVGSDGTIIHVNPKGTDQRAREPIVDTRDIAILLEQPALIEDPGDISKLKAIASSEAGRFFDLTRIDELAARDVGAIAKIDDDRDTVPSGLGHREAVHYDPAQRVGAAATGIQATDPDAPPVDDKLRTDRAVDENLTAAGTTVQDSSIHAGGEQAAPSHEDGSISTPSTKTTAKGEKRGK